MIGFFLFVVVGSSVLQIVQMAGMGGRIAQQMENQQPRAEPQPRPRKKKPTPRRTRDWIEGGDSYEEAGHKRAMGRTRMLLPPLGAHTAATCRQRRVEGPSVLGSSRRWRLSPGASRMDATMGRAVLYGQVGDVELDAAAAHPCHQILFVA